ncbi:anthranilate synthase [Corynebacterium frankenforstense DSM 45800]|uniref:anthranilate synthase n=1 Tax=Corynebacterium frankenforstense DSM 45800 TaxID=1437875 RepID=A0A1L7CV70_9CORY|nr:anthranilate synthase component 1 [Corynebacterium frankenforstense]APT89733.1 anthranilate synthase [Corynebacterium frankenforstense DSM 45800]
MLERTVAYREDASGLFAHLGGATAPTTALLESADITTRSGISSLGILASSLRLTCTGDRVTVEEFSAGGTARHAGLDEELAETPAKIDAGGYTFPASTAADERERLTAASTVEPLRRLQNSGGLLVGGFAFDYLGTFEELPEVPDGPNTFPDYQFLLAEIVLEINHRDNSARIYALAYGDGEKDRLDAELDRLARLAEGFTDAPDAATADDPAVTAQATAGERGHAGTLPARATQSDAEFRAAVERLKGNIYSGDIYQVVPARAFTTECPDAFAAYRRLRAENPSPYMFYLRGATDRPFELFGASPESNLKYTAADRTLRIYPIAGTRPRGATDELDIRNELTLRTDAKELAEHTMLVDLARNDVARVCEPGTRKVIGLMDVDRYSAVMHLVSKVAGTLAEGLDALDAYRACMNMGTLTGAPKLRASELLREAEGVRRGSYGGAVGYLDGAGDMDTCIVIRSAFVQDGVATVQAGAGVVRDSDPQAEADETLHKAYAVLHALAEAQNKELEVIR